MRYCSPTFLFTGNVKLSAHFTAKDSLLYYFSCLVQYIRRGQFRIQWEWLARCSSGLAVSEAAHCRSMEKYNLGQPSRDQDWRTSDSIANAKNYSTQNHYMCTILKSKAFRDLTLFGETAMVILLGPAEKLFYTRILFGGFVWCADHHIACIQWQLLK